MRIKTTMAERVAGGKRPAQDEASDPQAKRHRDESVCGRIDSLDAKVDDLIARTDDLIARVNYKTSGKIK